MQLYTNEEFGFCVLVPQGFDISESDYETQVFFFGPEYSVDSGPMGWVKTSDAQGKSAMESAAPALAEWETIWGKPAEPEMIAVAGEEAVRIDGLPGQDVTRKVFVVHARTLYEMAFLPSTSNYEHYDTVMALYEAMIGSFTFAQ
jgi:hypothetical protein